MKNPENRVEPYAMIAVMARSRPAPLPSSPMAGVTRPTIISGMVKERKFPNRELMVVNIRAIGIGSMYPKVIPSNMANATLPRSETLILFIY